MTDIYSLIKQTQSSLTSSVNDVPNRNVTALYERLSRDDELGG